MHCLNMIVIRANNGNRTHHGGRDFSGYGQKFVDFRVVPGPTELLDDLEVEASASRVRDTGFKSQPSHTMQ